MEIALMALGVVTVLVTPLAVLCFQSAREVKALVSQEVDLSKLDDGVYASACKRGRWTFDVAVSVRDHRIVSIVCNNTRAHALPLWQQPAANALFATPATTIDVVSGATLNTRAFGRAVARALSVPASSLR
ncbi:MAG: FMN-binding protein [Polyangiales bacterium]